MITLALLTLDLGTTTKIRLNYKEPDAFGTSAKLFQFTNKTKQMY